MTTFSNVPSTDHWAILRKRNIVTPGDERSRAHPGHGYPESTETITEYKAYTTKEHWIIAIQQLEESKIAYKAIEVKVPKIRLVTRVLINDTGV